MKRKGATKDLEVQANKYYFLAMHKTKVTDKSARFVTLNDYIRAERSSGQWAAAIKSRETDSIVRQAKHLQLKPYEGKYPVDVYFTWHTNTRKDSDNIAFVQKFILDGMVKAGLIIDDSPKYVADLHHRVKRKQMHISNESVTVRLEEHSDE